MIADGVVRFGGSEDGLFNQHVGVSRTIVGDRTSVVPRCHDRTRCLYLSGRQSD
jgi:hypothetical protein